MTSINATMRIANEAIYSIPDICNLMSSYLIDDSEVTEIKAVNNRWLHWFQTRCKSNGTITTKAMDYAAKKGRLDVVKWLHDNRKEGCTTRAMNKAAKNGHVEIVKYLHENRTEGCTTDAMTWAAMNGRLNVVKWLKEHIVE